MSENLKPEHLDALFENFKKQEAVFEDPFVLDVLQQAREFNELLASTDTTEEERVSIMQRVDAAWGSLRGGTMKFTGTAHGVYDGVFREEFLDEAMIQSNGFVVVGGEEDEVNGGAYRLVHHLYIPKHYMLDAIGQLEIDEVTHMTATSEIDTSMLEFVDRVSPERAAAWLQYSCPELFEEIETTLFNTRGGEEKSLLALRMVRLNKHQSIQDTLTRACLTVHLNEVLRLDKGAPYAITAGGLMRLLHGEDEESAVRLDSKFLANIHDIRVLRSVTLNDGFDKYDIMLNLTMITNDRESDTVQVHLPVSSIKYIQSMRDNFYNS